MNKRVMKVVEKLQTGNKTIVSFRRDQLKKAIDENAFDIMKTYDYDELQNAGRKTIINPTLKDIELSWLENGDIWATIENNTLEVVVKYGYSTRRFYIDLMKEYKEEYNNVDLENSEDDELSNVEIVEEVEEQSQQKNLEGKKVYKIISYLTKQNSKNWEGALIINTNTNKKYITNGVYKWEATAERLAECEEVNKIDIALFLDRFNKYIGNIEILEVKEVEEQQTENNNIIDLSSYRSKEAAKEIKQLTKDNKIKICVCGSILKGEEIQLGICRNCIEYVYSTYLDGTLKECDENLYNMIHEAMEK